MTFETEKPHIYAHGTAWHLFDAIFTDDLVKRRAMLDEWRQCCSPRPEPDDILLEHGGILTMTPDDSCDIDIDAEMEGLFSAKALLAGMFGPHEVPERVPLADADTTELDAELLAMLEAFQGCEDGVPFPSGMVGIAGDDPLYQLTKLVPEDRHA